MLTLLLSLALGCRTKIEVPIDDTSDSDSAACTAAEEVCDGVDNDCDGLVDDVDPDRTGASTWYADGDGDGYGDLGTGDIACDEPEGTVSNSTDCDDAEGTVYPGADEVCDGLDNDCDGLTDGQDDSLFGAPTWYSDSDGDGYGGAPSDTPACVAPPGTVGDGDDCDDTDARVNPDADEICDDRDNDCDTLVDGQDDSVVGAPSWYTDADSDGYGDATSGTSACNAPRGTVSNSTDCDDGDPGLNPGESEVCDDIDNDCDTLIDGLDDSLSDGIIWYADADGDGYGDPSNTTVACSRPPGCVANNIDCDDTSSSGTSCAPASCLVILDNGDSTGDGLYWLDPEGTGAIEAYCDMTTEGGGWTLVAWIESTSHDHANNTGQVSDPALRSPGAKYSDSMINTLTTGGYWRYECGSSKRAYVRTASGTWTSMYVNSEDWSMDNDRDGTFECAANRNFYVFSDYPACSSGHSNYGEPPAGESGCYVDGEGWRRSGSLWAR